MTERRRLRSAVAWLTASALGSRVLGAATGVVTARALGPGGRGTFALLLLAGLIGGAIASGGMDLWAARMLAQGADGSSVRRVLRRHQLGSLALAAVVAALIVGITRVDPALTAVTAGLGWLTASATLKLGLLQGANHMGAYSWAIFAGSTTYAAAVFGAAAVGAGAVTTFLLAAGLGKTITAAWPSRPRRPADRVGSPETSSYRTAFAFGGTTMLGGLVTIALYRLDVALVAALSSTSDAGVYSVALALAEVLWVLPNSAAQAVLPRTSADFAGADTAKVNRVIVAAMVVVSAAVSLSGPIVIPFVFGAEFQGAARALPGLALGSVAVGSWKLLAHDLLARGDARTRLFSGVAGVGVMIALDLLLVPSLGIVGASLGSLGGYLTAAVITLRAWRRRTGASLAELLVLRRGDIASIVRRRRSAPLASADSLAQK